MSYLTEVSVWILLGAASGTTLGALLRRAVIRSRR